VKSATAVSCQNCGCRVDQAAVADKLVDTLMGI
jgi:hypothetical protein